LFLRRIVYCLGLTAFKNISWYIWSKYLQKFFAHFLQVLTEHLKFVENHRVIDTRLAICTIACLFAVAALIYDYFIPFPNSRPVLILCVLSYPLESRLYRK
jgi:hypothetical protein